MQRYEEFFQKAMGNTYQPFPYQITLAEKPFPQILHIPTGLGKTAAVVISWLYKYSQETEDVPRRLVYCLPMRVLVEQTFANCQRWVQNLVDGGILSEHDKPSVHCLMGGMIDKDWDQFPERRAIIIGTQDQLLSRALNRGYSMSRFRWPMQFGLLHNDCLWIMDEVQLMGPGLATTTQLEAFRKDMGVVAPSSSIWMSATLNPDWLRSVDFKRSFPNPSAFTLNEKDRSTDTVRLRTASNKLVTKADVPFSDIGKLASFTLSKHEKGTLTLVVVNTVKRAQELYSKIERLRKGTIDTCLVHSRFRPPERKAAIEKLLKPISETGRICISTQVVEAGVDISCKTLITDPAPWGSLVQRFGRNNRNGEYTVSNIFWLNPQNKITKIQGPYDEEAIRKSMDILEGMEGQSASPDNLPEVSEQYEPLHVLRRKDILDLFDTSSDLSGFDVDVSRFIREANDRDLYVFWRSIPASESPDSNEPSPQSEEICSVPIGALKERRCWKWDHLEERWVPTLGDRLSPGMTVMLRTEDGGYSTRIGWTGNGQDIPETLLSDISIPEEGNDNDPLSVNYCLSLAEHTENVISETQTLLAEFPDITETIRSEINTAALWHDFGKEHPVCQEAFKENIEGYEDVLLGKTNSSSVRYSRPGFRHELASAVAMIQNGCSPLSSYIAASHHGKIRLSIRSLPNENKPPEASTHFARGVWDGDVLPPLKIRGKGSLPETRMDLSIMECGETDKGESWLSRMLALRDNPNIGPFRLSFYEALLRCADWRASKKEGDNNEQAVS